MTRTLSTLATLAALSQGCIIYEERYHGHCRNCGDDDTIVVGDDDDATEPTEPEPTEPEPVVTADLVLTVDSAKPGESVLSTLVSVGEQPIDLTEVLEVGFERDVEVLDTLVRSDEVVLLLQVDEAAQPGEVVVFVETVDGVGWILEQPFTILDPHAGGTDPGTDPGGDTGVPCP